MTRTIKVSGKSNVKASPDYTRINLTLSDTLKEYDACLAKSVEDMNIIVECIKEFGFERKELKTSNFEINRKTEGYRDKHNDWKYRFIGYEYTENLNFIFKNDNERLGKILEKFDLPVSYEGDRDTALSLISTDKKRQGNDIDAILVSKIGGCEIRRMSLEKFTELVKKNTGGNL
jgi:hypothetical protein